MPAAASTRAGTAFAAGGGAATTFATSAVDGTSVEGAVGDGVVVEGGAAVGGSGGTVAVGAPDIVANAIAAPMIKTAAAAASGTGFVAFRVGSAGIP